MRRPHLSAASAAVALATAGLLLTTATPATAHGASDAAELLGSQEVGGLPAPLITSDNVRPLRNVPGSAGISGCFLQTAPLFVMSSLDSITVYDVRNPEAPTRVGTLPSAQFENEAMNCGERKTKSGTKRFALIGVDLYQVSPNDPNHVNAGDGNELVIVDVTNPSTPKIMSRAPGTTSTHTVSCIDETDCTYAYSAGGRGLFSIFDLRNLAKPVELDADPNTPGTQAFRSPTPAHKWNFDAAGYGTHTGFDGSSIFDVSDPRQPRLVTTTGAAGRGEDPAYPGYNDFIHHNSFRPNASAFAPFAAPSLANGNVLLITEEDYEQTDCSQAGSFQTWKVNTLDGSPDAIVPLDKVELSDLGNFPSPVGAFCSAHWFSYHPSGIVAIGFYGGGMQLIDVRDPLDIKPYGHAVSGVSEVWDAYWMPVYNKAGRMTNQKTDIVYAVDLVRGLDVFQVDLPGTSRLAEPTTLGAGNPLTTLAWPDEGVPLVLLGLALVGSAVLRRRVRPTGS